MGIQKKFISTLQEIWSKDLELEYQQLYRLLDLPNLYPDIAEKVLPFLISLSEKVKALPPQFVKANLTEYKMPGEYTLKQNFSNWRSKTKISLQTAASLAVMISLFSKESDYLDSLGIDTFKTIDFPIEKLIEPYLSLLHLEEKDKKLILSGSDSLALFLFFILLYGHLELEGKTDLKTFSWVLSSTLKELLEQDTLLSSNPKLKTFEKAYYKRLWDNNNKLFLKDVNNRSFSSVKSQVDIPSFYVVPSLSYSEKKEAEDIVKPFMGEDPFNFLALASTGSGKSSLIRALTAAILSSRADLFLKYRLTGDTLTIYDSIRSDFGLTDSAFPMVIVCDDLNWIDASSLRGKELIDLIQGVKEEEKETFKALLKEKLSKNTNCILLIDGLDELSGDDKKFLFSQKVKDFLETYDNISVLVTSRPIDLKSFDLITWPLSTIYLKPFKPTQRKTLIKNWYKQAKTTLSSEEKRKERAKLLNNEYLDDLAGNPYLLTRILDFMAHDSSATVKKIISYLIDQLIDKHSPTGEPSLFASETIRKILGAIAWEMKDSEKHVIHPKDLDNTFREKAKELNLVVPEESGHWTSVVKEMNARAGLIVLNETGEYVFQYPVLEKLLAVEGCRSEIERKRESNLKGKLKKKGKRGKEEESFYENLSKEILTENINNTYKTDLTLMLLSSNKETRRDKLPEYLFKELLNKTSTSLDKKELVEIAKIFIALIRNTYDTNTLTNPRREGLSTERLQIIRFLGQNSHLFENLKDIQSLSEYDSMEELLLNEFKEEYNTLVEKKLIR